ncbi:Uncharacterised protein [Metamycoplasma arthritidis]|uniref:Hypothetical membrane protein n=1 Tax=Metamycoplasma arthritidis (strain 158L3-1) TaxID=243272 RepID=B3PMU9_META1|nr:hypothetical protein [Metamycoplasma arthritidis]ACF07351.1 hypothetical membrane protein [Metamycoplasma arthritidis 158L3-1]VEU78873.1 Uncharacterised protein [Metamycoplasma arthritidis]
MNRKILLGTLTSLTLLPTILLSASTSINSKNEKTNNLAVKNNVSRPKTKVKYAINIDNKEMIFDSKERIYDYLSNKIQINGYLGKKEYKNYDGQINMDPNKLNSVDFAKIKKAYKDIHGNYTDNLDTVIRSYLPEFAIAKRYYDHRNRPFKDAEDAKNSIIQNSTDDIVDNLFYKLNYHSNGQTIKKHYNPYNEYDVKELMQDIYDRKVLVDKIKTFEALKLKADDGSERFLSYKGPINNFFSTLFTKAIQEFTNQATKKRYKVTLKLPRMDKMAYRNYGKAYFKSFSSNDDNEWQYANGNRTEIYKYVDEDWLKEYFEELELLKNSEVTKEFVNKNFNRYYSGKLWKEVIVENRRIKRRISKPYYNHYADLKGKFLDFKSLNLMAQNNQWDNRYITVLDHDKWTYNNFGLEVNVEFDKNNFNNKMASLKSEFAKGNNYFFNLRILLANVIRKLTNNLEEWKCFSNLELENDFWKNLWNFFEEELNKFIKDIMDTKGNNYAGLRFDDSSTYYQKKKNELSSSQVNLDLIKIFSKLKTKIDEQKISYYETTRPIFHKTEKHEFVNLTNKKVKTSQYFDFINLKEIISTEDNEDFIKNQKEFITKRKINHIDNYSNYFNLANVEKAKYKNFIQYKELSNGNYQLNNSYSPLKTFKDDTEVNAYLKKIKEDGVLPETRHIIVGLESILNSHDIKMLLEELEFNDPSTITNNYRMILQKLILPSTEKAFYLDKNQKYLLDLSYFNLWNIKINNEKYHFESSSAITQFIMKYVDLYAKQIS